MAAIVTSPRFSFIQFDPEETSSPSPVPVDFKLPVVYEDDIAFQFYVETDTVAEADEICTFGTQKVEVGIAELDGTVLMNFTTGGFAPERHRVGERRLLFYWPHGLPDFDTVVAMNDCFKIFVKVTLVTGVTTEYSNELQRTKIDNYSTVLEYGADTNMYQFNYCGSVEDEPESDTDTLPVCDATVYSFSNQSILSYAYTQAMRDKYGDVPTVEVWLFNSATSKFEKTIVSIVLDAVPTTLITVDLGGSASGYIKIY